VSALTSHLASLPQGRTHCLRASGHLPHDPERSECWLHAFWQLLLLLAPTGTKLPTSSHPLLCCKLVKAKEAGWARRDVRGSVASPDQRRWATFRMLCHLYILRNGRVLVVLRQTRKSYGEPVVRASRRLCSNDLHYQAKGEASLDEHPALAKFSPLLLQASKLQGQRLRGIPESVPQLAEEFRRPRARSCGDGAVADLASAFLLVSELRRGIESSLSIRLSSDPAHRGINASP
jgi:hypothetical protein